MAMVKMNNSKNKNSRGYTLVELVITIMISGILFFAVGTIIIQSETWWMKQSRTAASFDDQMYARKFIEWQIKSSTGPYTVTDRKGPAAKIQFYGFKDNLSTSVTTHRIIFLEGTNLKYKEENKQSTGTQIIADEVIISSVSGFVITPRPDGPMSDEMMPAIVNAPGFAETPYQQLQSTVTLYGFFIEQYKNVFVGNSSTPQQRKSSFRFTVNSRNLAQGLTVVN